MSNLETGNWGEYQRLVLAELERHNKLLQTVDDRIQGLKVEIELLKQLRQQLEDLQKIVKDNTKDISSLEKGEDVDDALKKYRNWIVGLLFVFVTALLLPVINLILHSFGGRG
jgi:hypothetical protein